MQITLVELLAKKVQEIESDFDLKKPTKKILQEEYDFSEKRAEAFMQIYSASNIFVTNKYIKFAERYELLEPVAEPDNKRFRRYKLTQRGESFVNKDLSTLAEIDLSEMLLLILDDIGKYEDSDDISLDMAIDELFPLHESRTPFEFGDSRISNLLDRGLISKRYDSQEEIDWYKISKKGKKYLKFFRGLSNTDDLLEKLFLAKNGIERLKLLKYLSLMEPYKFEYFIGRILEKMGYQDIVVTSSGNDGGIDIKAEIRAGTSTIKEIIQVKRWNSNIQRPAIDQLRGVLSTSDATRGSIFTISDFSKGCYESAKNDSSINLINGEQLLNLLFKYGVGVKPKGFDLYRFMPSDIDSLLKGVKTVRQRNNSNTV